MSDSVTPKTYRWRRVPRGTFIAFHYFLEDRRCVGCGYGFRVMTSASETGGVYYWNGEGDHLCPAASGRTYRLMSEPGI